VKSLKNLWRGTWLTTSSQQSIKQT